MLKSLLKRHGITMLGTTAVVAVVVASLYSLGHMTVNRLTETTLRAKAAEFAATLTGPDGQAQAFLTGISREADPEARLRRLATMVGLSDFALFDTEGREVFRSRSKRYDWLLRDRPGGITSGDRLSPSVIARDGPFAIYRDTEGVPEVLRPLEENGRRIGFVAVGSELPAYRIAFGQILLVSIGSLLFILVLLTGLPLLVYLQRKRKIDQAAQRIYFLANHDTLTRLLNRSKMQDETDRALLASRALRERLAYLYLDIDELSEINTSGGQSFGDEVLKIVAERLSQVVEPGDLLARIAADDFTILKRHVENAIDVERFAERVHTVVSAPIRSPSGMEVRPKISIGAAWAPENGRSHSDLLEHAELAHQHSKGERSQGVTFYAPEMEETVSNRRQLENLLRRAIDDELFELHYQPLMSGDGTAILGFEALVRMRDETGEIIPPGLFIPIAEARGYIKDIGTWVIREATRQIAQWPEDLFVSVNLSAVQFTDGDLVDIVSDALSAAGIGGGRLELEVVESLVLDRSDLVLDQLTQLKALGISIAMDDFGTGFSSLGYLWRFPFDKLKIDQSFMMAYARGEANVDRIIEATIAMAHHIKMKVTAEGVETAEQVEMLGRFGCDQIQGYYFGRPMPPEEAAAEILARFRVGKAAPGRNAAGPTVLARAAL